MNTPTLSPEKRALLEQRLGATAHKRPKTPIIPRRPRPDSASLSFAQRQMWIIDQMMPGNPAYNVPHGYRLRGPLDLQALEDSFNEVIKRHEALRTTFIAKDGEPEQCIHSGLKIELNVVTLDQLPPERREDKSQALASAESVKPFDLSQLPLIRVSVFKLAEAEHVLIINLHHIVADGLSTVLLLNELDIFYRAFTEGTEPRPPTLMVQYGDFAHWQQQTMSNEAPYARQFEFWQKQLGGTLPVLELPADKPRPALQSFNGSNVFFNIPAELVQHLKALSRREGCTFYVIVLAAFEVLLHRYSSAEDIVLGTPIAARTPEELAPLIGLILNMVGLRCDLSGDPTFSQLLRRTRDMVLDATSNGDVPLELLMKHLKVQRDPSRNPIFQAVLQVLPASNQRIGDLDVSSFYFDLKFAQFDLTLHLYEQAAGYQGRFDYCTDLFERETIERLSRNFVQLLRAIAIDADGHVSRLPILANTERQQLLDGWNQTTIQYPPVCCVHERVEAQARLRPDALAVASDFHQLTYRELNERAERLAARLQKHGVHANSLVAVYLERSVEMIVALLAVWKAGGAYVPIDQEYPPERVRFMLDDTKAVVVLTQPSLNAALPATNAQVLDISFDEGGAVAQRLPSAPAQLAYVIYTSGSTGRPKGVPITHASLFNLICWHQQAYAVTVADRATQIAGPAFDASVWEIWPYLAAGASVHIPDDARRLSAERLVHWLSEQQITLSFLPTPLAEAALRESWPETTALRVLLTGGDRLTHRPTRKLPFRLVNHYGPTENTVVSTCAEVHEGDSKTAPSIGRPLPNTQVYVVDQQLQPVPIGVPGELLVGGVQLTSGYWNRPKLTAEKFITNPFHAGRVYKTGDLVRWLPDGNLEYLGRTDHQVKIRGFRIELGEVESVLRRHSAVREAIALVREDTPGDRRLVAYIVAHNRPDNLIDELRTFLGASLPQYMIPAAFVFLDSLPLTPNGKIDREKLPAPERSHRGRYLPPGTPTQEMLASIFSDVLGLERVGAEDNFFELGGNSLLAMRVVSRVRQALGVELPLRDLFVAPTVSQTATRIEALRPALTGPPLQPSAERGPAELSFSQQRLWFLERMERGSATYNIPAALELRGPLDASVLERALKALINRHESLRTRFAQSDGQPFQVVLQPGPWTLPVIDLSGAPPEQLWKLLRTEAAPGFDLARGTLFRAHLYRLAQDRHVLLLTMHHIISDGWSMGILIHELATLYEAFSRGETPALAELRIQYRDFARWQRNWLKGQAVEGLLSYWRTRLAGAPQVLELPADRPRPAVESHRGALYSFTLPMDLANALRGFARREGATLFMSLLSGFTLVLSRYSGQRDLLVGTPVAGRNRTEIENLVGFFVNTLVLRTDLSGNPSATKFLRHIREVCLDAFAHQDLPFERLVEEMRPARDLSRSPLIQVMFALQNAPLQPLSLPKLSQKALTLDLGVSRFDLTLQMQETDEGISGCFEYATDLFDESTIARMANHLKTLLGAMCAKPEENVWNLPLLTEPERQQVLDRWNTTAAQYPAARCTHELVEEQVQMRPDALAVASGSRQLTYKELDECAERLAARLRKHRVRANSLVAIYLERSIEMIVALLAVWKAGGAYVPIDQEYPTERVRFMLEDTNAVVVLTQQSLAATLPATNANVLDIAFDEDVMVAQPSPPSSPEQLAYVIYTSGSTGRPKGVPITHASLFNLICWHQQAYGVTPADRATQIAGPAFDASVWEIWPYLAAGASVHVPDDATRLEAGRLVRWLTEQRITLSFLPTPLAEAALSETWSETTALRVLLTGGDKLTHRPTQNLPFRLINHYGPTENTVVSTCAEVLAGDGQSPPLIGRPLPNTYAYVLDRQLQPVPIGVPGELLVSGAQLTSGYWNRPELTAEKFIANPFHGGRLYKTGDLVRWLPDGNIEFLSRIDQQVKIRGLRIELGEIESVLRRHPAVGEAVALAREDVPGDKRLVAYMVLRDRPDDLVDELRTFLCASLPQYMVPAAFVFMEAFPLTPNGKLDRNALPAPEGAAYNARAYEAPLDDIETALAQIWSDVLKMPRVGRNDHFFDLGGHSLLAVSVIERMRQQGLHADVRSLFASPTLAGLAAAVSRNGHIVEVPPNPISANTQTITPEMLPLVQLTSHQIEQIVRLVPGGAANIQDIYPLAPLQEGILFHHLMATEGDPYLLRAWFTFDSRGRLDRYLEAVQAVVNRHDILRTAVLWEGLPEPVQVVWRHAQLPVEEFELRPRAGDAIEQLGAHVNPRYYRLDVRQAPMLRVFITRDPANGRWVMLQLFHHLSLDHTTLEVMQREIQAHLHGRAGELPTPLPFRNFVAQARFDPSREEDEAFFQKLLGDVDEPTAPFGLLNVQGDGSQISEAHSALDAALARRLRERARALGVSAASIFHLAWALVLARVSGRDDVVFGTLLLGRMQGGEGADRALGLFINTLPVRIRIGTDSAEDSIRQTHALLGQLLRHEHASLALAQRCSAVAPPAPLFSAILNYRHAIAAAQTSFEARDAWKGIEFLGGEERTNYPLVLSVDDLGEGFSLKAQIQSPIDPHRICAFVHRAVEQLIGALESAPSTSLRSLDVLPVAERQILLVEWNNSGPVKAEGCLHHLIEGQAARTPERAAVICGQQTLTYDELNRRANQLAHHLTSVGVRPDVPVAIYLERSINMLVAIIGILKAGGAYVPLDPNYPSKRVSAIMEDAIPLILLTQKSLINTLPTLVQSIALDDWADIASNRIENLSTAVKSENLAYVLFTSGSTGRPKGVALEHRSAVAFVAWANQIFTAQELAGVLFSTSICFDLSVFEIFVTLSAGGKIIVAQNALELPSIPAKDDVTLINTVPSAIAELIRTRAVPPSVKTTNLAGEALSDTLAEQIYATTNVEKVYNLYGPTETTTYSTFTQVRRGCPVTIGKPIAGTQCYIFDAHGNPTPIGVPGELYIAGAGLARGYFGSPKLTNERFVPTPFSGGRMYRTGDLCQWLPDGSIQYLGRADQQVKLRGFRIELGEIEAAIAQHHAVREVAVIAREDMPGDKRLVAYLAAEKPPADLIDQIRAQVRGALPEYMLPAQFVLLKALPRTLNGKLDRKALPATPEGVSVRGMTAKPRTITEEMVLEVFCSVLARNDFGVSDNFFDLGGHSLMAARLISGLRTASGVDLPLRDLFVRPTVAALAEAIDARKWIENSKAPTDSPADREEIVL